MQPQRADVQPFFGFLAALEHLLATWQAHMQAARTAVRARHRSPGIVLRAIGSTRLLNAPAPLRLVGPEAPDRRDAQSDLQAAEEEARRQADAREIDASQKAVVEQLRDRYWAW